MVTPLDVTATVIVPADAAQVWQAAVDWPGQSRWIWATRVRGGHGAGATVTGWTGIGRASFTDPMVITEWDPPRRCVVRHTGSLIRGQGVFEVTPRGRTAHGPVSEFRWAEHLQLPLPPVIGRLAVLLLRPPARWGLSMSLRRFARLLAPT